jgi:methyl-accepting chemotaxis protein
LISKMNLTTKMMVFIGTVTAIALAATIIISYVLSSNMAIEEGFAKVEEMAYRYSNEVKAEIELPLDTARTLAQTFEAMRATSTPDRDVMNSILRNVLEKEERFNGVWTLWEPNALDGKDAEYAGKPGYDETGRFLPLWNRDTGTIQQVAIVDYETGDFYNLPKQTGEETVTNPYLYPVNGEYAPMSSIVVPIKYNGQFVGVAGVDVILGTFQDKVVKIRPYERGYASLVSNDGVYVADINEENIFTPIADEKAKAAIKNGEVYTTTEYCEILKEEVYKVYVPIKFGNTKTPWSFVVTAPMSKVMEKANMIRNASLILGIVALAILLVIIFFITRSVVGPIKELTNVAEKIAEDNLSTEINIIKTQDEVGNLSRAFHKMQQNLRDIAHTAEKIAQGDLSDDRILKEDGKQAGDLTGAFNVMVTNLKQLKNEIDSITMAVEEGKLGVRGNEEAFKGGWKELLKGINKTLDAVIAPIREASLVLQEVAKGNLNVAVTGDYKGENAIIKDNLNMTIDNINQILWEVTAAAEQVASSSRQVAVSSESLSQGATEQASTIEEITSSMEQIAAQTKQNAINANKASELALSVKNNAIQGKSHMEDMLVSMQNINKSSSDISRIIKVIDDIAFQTNILALNAAVEAARAGQHGKGFAVVAEEVRNLAERSARAARETTEMIESSIRTVETGTKIAHETAEALNKIVDGVTETSALAEEIASASKEQDLGISQVNQAISQVAEVIHANSVEAEESASANEELSKQANMLKESLSRFKLKPNSSEASKVDSIRPEVMRMLEDMVEKKMSSHHLDESKHKGKGNKEPETKAQILLDNKEFGKY